MASVAQLKGRIRSVNSTKQITGAMELVSASKMRRAASRTLATKPYHKHISDILMRLMDEGLSDGHPLFVHREVKTRLLIVVSSDTGLAGAYNANVMKKFIAEIERDRARDVKTVVIAAGKRITQFASRIDGIEVLGTYDGLSTGSAAGARAGIVDTAITMYRNAEVDAVDIIYTKYRSSINQEVKMWKLLPAGHKPGVDTEEGESYKFEPSKERVFGALVKRTIEIQIAQTVFDSAASEHSTRMLAMKNATDNANELVDDLTLAMNKERQAAITTELSDISNGANAVE